MYRELKMFMNNHKLSVKEIAILLRYSEGYVYSVMNDKINVSDEFKKRFDKLSKLSKKSIKEKVKTKQLKLEDKQCVSSVVEFIKRVENTTSRDIANKLNISETEMTRFKTKRTKMPVELYRVMLELYSSVIGVNSVDEEVLKYRARTVL